MDDDTRLGLCSNCGYKIQFMASVEGEEGRCPKCGSLQLLIPYSKTPTDAPFTEKETTPLISTDDGESKQLKVKEDSSILFVPFVRGVSASMSDQFVDHGGRTGSSSTAGIANDLTATVIKYEAEGYEFQKIETVHVDVSPGCLGMLMGKGKEYHPYDYLVFSKKPQKTFNHPV